MDIEKDSRIAALLARAGDQLQPTLLKWLFRSLDTLEQADMGDIEPVGVGSPVPPR